MTKLLLKHKLSRWERALLNVPSAMENLAVPLTLFDILIDFTYLLLKKDVVVSVIFILLIVARSANKSTYAYYKNMYF